MDFVQTFIDYTRVYESPTSFWKWSAYATVAALLRDNVYIDHGVRQTYPNIFVVLLAKSAENRKSGPFHVVSDILMHEQILNTKVVRGRNSIQALVDILSQDVSNKKTGVAIKGGSCIMMADEIASFFVEDPAVIPILTDMYDFRKEWDYTLKGAGKSRIKNLCVTFLAASNSVLLRRVYDGNAVYGGLLGRTFFVRPDEVRPANSLVFMDPKDFDLSQLIGQAKDITRLKGPVSFTKEAATTYDNWYKKLYDSYRVKKDDTGVTQRMHTGVLKLAIIIAASRGSKEINVEDMLTAITEVSSIRGNYSEFVAGAGKSSQAEIGGIFIAALAETGVITRRQLLVEHWVDISADQLDLLITTMEQAGLIKITAKNNELAYEMTESCRKLYRTTS